MISGVSSTTITSFPDTGLSKKEGSCGSRSQKSSKLPGLGIGISSMEGDLEFERLMTSIGSMISMTPELKLDFEDDDPELELDFEDDDPELD